MTTMTCSVCGGTTFTDRAVLWDGLVAEWQLAPQERAYVNRQQGTMCNTCGSNLRSIALANAMRVALGTRATLHEIVKLPAAAKLAVLEINEAGNLAGVLRTLPGHVFADFPKVDMQALPYESDRFDLVVHSDTLEHVHQPVAALAECRRVLRPGGVLCYTVPVIVGRMTRSRAGLPPSYHGGAKDPRGQIEHLRVQTEFGADAWTYPLLAGFEAVTLHSLDFPTAIAIAARKPTL